MLERALCADFRLKIMFFPAPALRTSLGVLL